MVKIRGEVSAKVTVKLSATEEKITKLNEEVAKLSKSTASNSSTLEDIMVSIENLGDNMVK